MPGPDPGQDEESGVVDDQVEMLPALFMAPADVTIARCAHPGGGAEAKQGDGLLLRAGDEIVPEREIEFFDTSAIRAASSVAAFLVFAAHYGEWEPHK